MNQLNRCFKFATAVSLLGWLLILFFPTWAYTEKAVQQHHLLIQKPALGVGRLGAFFGLWLVPVYLLTLMFGPAGVLAYLLLRAVLVGRPDLRMSSSA